MEAKSGKVTVKAGGILRAFEKENKLMNVLEVASGLKIKKYIKISVYNASQSGAETQNTMHLMNSEHSIERQSAYSIRKAVHADFEQKQHKTRILMRNQRRIRTVTVENTWKKHICHFQ